MYTHVEVLRKAGALALSNPSTGERAVISLAFVESISTDTEATLIVMLSGVGHEVSAVHYDDISGWFTAAMTGELGNDPRAGQ